MSQHSLSHRRATAIDRAAVLQVDYVVLPDNDTVIVASATTAGKLYTVTSKECTCPAGRKELPCKHAAYRLNILHPRTPAAPQSAAEYNAMVDRLNADLF
jgi:hypothetical protein